MNRRYLMLALAMGAAVVGLVLAFAPGLVAVVSLPELLPSLIASIAVVAGLYRAYQWLNRDAIQQSPPDPERGSPIAVPGDEFDTLLASTPSMGASSGDRRALKVRDELSDLALAVLTRYQGHSREEAIARLSNGTWTEDQLAAEFFATVGGSGSSLRESVTGTFWGEGPFRRRARHAAAELDRIADRGGED